MDLPNLARSVVIRVAIVVAVVGAAASYTGYLHERRAAKEKTAHLLSTEAKKVITPDLLSLPSPERDEALFQAVSKLAGNIFAIVDVYSPDGQRLMEAAQPGLDSLSTALVSLPHGNKAGAPFDVRPILGFQVIRVITPLVSPSGELVAFFEGVRVLDAEEIASLQSSALVAGLIAAASVLVCALVLAPLLSTLAIANYRRAKSLLEAHIGALEALGRAIAKRDSDTGIHNYRVTWMAARLGEEAGLDRSQMRKLIAGSFLHDVGKLGIPDNVLLKPGKLDAEELRIMRQHVELGVQIAGEAGILRDARDVIEAHHEKWDGSGYPKGLNQQSIPIVARIFCIADVYDALRAKRPYKEPFSLEKSLEIMRDGKGKHFDPHLLQIFETMIDEIEMKAIRASEEEAIVLTREMASKHFSFT